MHYLINLNSILLSAFRKKNMETLRTSVLLVQYSEGFHALHFSVVANRHTRLANIYWGLQFSREGNSNRCRHQSEANYQEYKAQGQDWITGLLLLLIFSFFLENYGHGQKRDTTGTLWWWVHKHVTLYTSHISGCVVYTELEYVTIKRKKSKQFTRFRECFFLYGRQCDLVV